MSLLFDENLSPRLVDLLHTRFPGSRHAGSAGLAGHPDRVVWDHARRHGLVIVSKDNDFRQLSFLFGPPPKVIWLSVGNAGTLDIARLLESRAETIHAFLGMPEEGLLVLELVEFL